MNVYKKLSMMRCSLLRRCFLKMMVIALFVFGGSCQDKEDTLNDSLNELNITGVSVPLSLEASIKENITFSGKGFAIGDVIRWEPTEMAGTVYSVVVTATTASTFTFALPDKITTGRYKLILVRGEKTLSLGTTNLNVVLNVDIPDKENMTIKGIVSCDGQGVPDVVVSDGYLVTKTDRDGIYYLASEKKAGYVFISIPGNYEVTTDGSAPLFYKKVSGVAVERKDFSLIHTDNNKHVVLAMADFHLAKRNDDLAQYDKCVNDMNELISQYKASGTKVYGLTLGDLTWELYWYSNNFKLPEYLPYINKVNAPVFNCMGNHDNDPYCADDWTAQLPYRNTIGPNYYSFNLGKVHYVVLDNIEYINAGGAPGQIGNRNYNNTITQEGMNWLKKDLETITDKSTPLVVAMHIQLHSEPNVNNSISVSLKNGQELIDALSAFSNVNVLTGHTHRNYVVKRSESFREHNVAAICATWWWTGRSGYANNHICKEGSVGGYKVFEVDNKDMEWYYKSVGYVRDYQFRSYDLNTIHITAEKYTPNADDAYKAKLPSYAGVYASSSDKNEVLINVWGYDPDWKVEVLENGTTPLAVTRVSALDPLHIISYEAKRLNANADPTGDFTTSSSSHMFKVTASSGNSYLDIKVTDCFGRVYTERMSRPKNFSYDMK